MSAQLSPHPGGSDAATFLEALRAAGIEYRLDLAGAGSSAWRFTCPACHAADARASEAGRAVRLRCSSGCSAEEIVAAVAELARPRVPIAPVERLLDLAEPLLAAYQRSRRESAMWREIAERHAARVADLEAQLAAARPIAFEAVA